LLSDVFSHDVLLSGSTANNWNVDFYRLESFLCEKGLRGNTYLHWSRPDLTTSTPRELFFKQPTELSADSNLFQSPDNGLQEMSA
jgi:hypothetical protein